MSQHLLRYEHQPGFLHPHFVRMRWTVMVGDLRPEPKDSAYFVETNHSTGRRELRQEILDWLNLNYPGQWIWHGSVRCVAFRQEYQAMFFLTLWAGYRG